MRRHTILDGPPATTSIDVHSMCNRPNHTQTRHTRHMHKIASEQLHSMLLHAHTLLRLADAAVLRSLKPRMNECYLKIRLINKPGRLAFASNSNRVSDSLQLSSTSSSSSYRLRCCHAAAACMPLLDLLNSIIIPSDDDDDDYDNDTECNCSDRTTELRPTKRRRLQVCLCNQNAQTSRRDDPFEVLGLIVVAQNTAQRIAHSWLAVIDVCR